MEFSFYYISSSVSILFGEAELIFLKCNIQRLKQNYCFVQIVAERSYIFFQLAMAINSSQEVISLGFLESLSYYLFCS